MKYQYLRINPLAYLICVMNKFRVGKTHPEKNQGGSKPTLPTLFRRPCPRPPLTTAELHVGRNFVTAARNRTANVQNICFVMQILVRHREYVFRKTIGILINYERILTESSTMG